MNWNKWDKEDLYYMVSFIVASLILVGLIIYIATTNTQY